MYPTSYGSSKERNLNITYFFQNDLPAIKEKYQELYEKCLNEMIEQDCPGHYKGYVVSLHQQWSRYTPTDRTCSYNLTNPYVNLYFMNTWSKNFF